MRSVSDQTVADLGGRWSVLTRQKLDHVELDRLLEAVQAGRGDEQRRLLLKTYRLVFPHAFAEESVLWPVLRAELPDGHALTLRVEQEHQEVNELVTLLENLGDAHPERDEVLRRLVTVLRDDVRDEEDELLPRLQEKLSPARLRALGVAWEAVRRTAPTRPHPVVARRPPGNVAAALPLTVTDRLRDLLETAAL
ncbi:hemerythrin domain-containing protein, partial [Dietzia sp. E1]|uniref:hemerythrin domain-containing protein n=1 Tax=Dietzia sp. E1 TaxID=328361 RepID=UPI0015FE3226